MPRTSFSTQSSCEGQKQRYLSIFNETETSFSNCLFKNKIFYKPQSIEYKERKKKLIQLKMESKRQRQTEPTEEDEQMARMMLKWKSPTTQIFVLNLRSKTMTFDVDLDYPIALIKYMIHQREPKLLPSLQRLSFGSRYLMDAEKTLREEGIHAEATLQLSINWHRLDS
jgi:hypothetical protein